MKVIFVLLLLPLLSCTSSKVTSDCKSSNSGWEYDDINSHMTRVPNI